MTSEEKQRVITLAAKYEPYDVSFITLLRLFGEAPKDKSFDEAFQMIDEKLGKEHGNDKIDISTAGKAGV